MYRMRALCANIRASLRSHFSTEIDEELRFHIEEQTRDDVPAGMAPAEARRQALLSFGGLERVREEWRR